MSTTDQPAPKRKRTDGGDGETQLTTNPLRSEIWFEDGNVVLQATGTQFKVHRGILSQSSPVFKAMFLLPQPPSFDGDMIEGCPIVHLSDSAEVEYALGALFQRKHVFTGKQLPLTILDSFLVLGSKYDIEVLRAEALTRLYHEIPTTLAGFDARDNWSMIERPWSYMELGSLARKNGLLSLLPYLLYCCCVAHNALEITNGVEKPDGTTALLSLRDQLACLAGYVSLVKVQATTTLSWIYPNATIYTSCGMPDICTVGRDATLIENFIPIAPIQGLHKWDDIYRGGIMCEHCIEAAKAAHQEGRHKLWAQLPAIFGLPAWDELVKERVGF